MTNTIYGLFEEIVRNQPETTAIIENERTMTFRALPSKMKLAGSLAAAGSAISVRCLRRITTLAPTGIS